MTALAQPAAAGRPAAPEPPGRQHRGPTWAISAVTLLVILALWWAATAAALVEPLFLPPPQAIVRKLLALAGGGYVDASLWAHAWASLSRVFLALGTAVVTAVPAGLAIGLSRVGRGVLDPIIEAYRPVPPLAYLPLIVIWFGIGEFSKVLLITLAMVAPIAIATADGVRSVPQDRVRAARALGATRSQVIGLVILPSALPQILVGIRIGLGAGWSTLVAAELIAATRGLGFMVQTASQFLNTDVVIVGILVIAAVAFALETALRLIQRLAVPWQQRA